MELARDNQIASRPDIFQYHDYRSFLKDYFDYLKLTQPRFSLRNLAKDAKLSCAYLPMVLAEKRALTGKSLQKLLPQLGLNPQESSYFELMQRAMEADTEDLRLRAMERIHRLGSYQKANPKEVETFKYLSHWFYVAIREMAQWKEFRADPKWIQRRLSIKVQIPEIKQALDFLIENKFIRIQADGTSIIPEKNIKCVGEVFQVALRQFHREMNDVSLEAIEQSGENEHHILGHTLNIPKDKFHMAKRILHNALQQISELEESSTASNNTIYHIHFMAAPLTNHDDDGGQS